MTKKVLLLSLVLILTLVLSACGKKTQDNELGVLDIAKNVNDYAKLGHDLQKAQESGDISGAMEKVAKFQADFAKQEYEKAQAIDAPAGFPKDLIYNEGKILEVEDSSDETYIDQSVSIKSQAEGLVVKDFYKNLLSSGTWKITSQSAASDSASFSAKDSNSGLSVSVDIYFGNTMNYPLTEISIDYSGEKK